MISQRLLKIASLIDKDDIVVDVGCDHGYLAIYLKENNLCKRVYASDISINALNYARKNIQKKDLDIKTFVSDGLNDINVSFNTVVLAGMGTSTILSILKNKKIPNKLVIASNNEYYKLRKNINEMGYKINKELVVFENNHYYIILECIKGLQKLSYSDLKFGISFNNDYYQYLINKNIDLIKKVPLKKKFILLYDNFLLKKLLKKSWSISIS